MLCWAQISVNRTFLQNSVWKLADPKDPDRYTEIIFTENKIKTSFQFSKIKKKINIENEYYLSNTTTTTFDNSKVGVAKNGCYIIKKARNRVICLKIVSVNINSIRLQNTEQVHDKKIIVTYVKLR